VERRFYLTPFLCRGPWLWTQAGASSCRSSWGLAKHLERVERNLFWEDGVRMVLGGGSHVSEVERHTYDLSQTRYPAYAVMGYGDMIAKIVVEVGAEDFVGLVAGASDALPDFKCLRPLWALAYDASPGVRDAVVRRGFWKPVEGSSGFAALEASPLSRQCNPHQGFPCL